MAWVYLLIAGLLEIVWAYFMKQSEGFTRLWPSVLTIAFMIVSFVLLSTAMKQLPMGTAYVIWTGIGAVGAFVVGVVLLGESLTVMRVLAALLVVAGWFCSASPRAAPPTDANRRCRCLSFDPAANAVIGTSRPRAWTPASAPSNAPFAPRAWRGH